MKKINVFILILLCYNTLYSQNIIDIFYMLPEEHSNYLSIEQRKSIVKFGKVIEEDNSKSIFIDKKSGYLSITTSYNVNTEAKFEICYWNFKNKKLVAISVYGGNPRTYNYGQSEFIFFIYDNDKLEISDKPIFKNYYPNLEVTKRFLITDFYSKMTRKEIIEYESLYPSLIFSLPRKGKNIEISYKTQKTPSDYGPFFDTPVKILKWNGDGTFSQ